jgi:hypothetical protein
MHDTEDELIFINHDDSIFATPAVLRQEMKRN